jgi:hypothetical protein
MTRFLLALCFYNPTVSPVSINAALKLVTAKFIISLSFSFSLSHDICVLIYVHLSGLSHYIETLVFIKHVK